MWTRTLLTLLSLYYLSWVHGYPLQDCRSSKSEIKWIRQQPENDPSWQQQRRKLTSPAGVNNLCLTQSVEDAKKDAWKFLRTHIIAFDEPMLETLGFGTDIDAPDGLQEGLIEPTIEYALKSKELYPWADALPQDLFYEYVLNYANVNEARSNWRPLIWGNLNPLIPSTGQKLPVNDVVRLVNQHLWNSFSTPGTIYFKSGQTPLIFDPFSVIVYGYGSCTGLAILFVNALRTVGVAARLVGTPAWNGLREKGNHNWVEVYDFDYDDPFGGEWKFLEPSANQTKVNDLSTKPCENWFCNPDRFPPSDSSNATPVFAARLVFGGGNKVHYPMAWERNNKDVPGENRTDYYSTVCSQC